LARERIEMPTLHEACHLARTAGEVADLMTILSLILTDRSSY
jgi:hypothetical protein